MTFKSLYIFDWQVDINFSEVERERERERDREREREGRRELGIYSVTFTLISGLFWIPSLQNNI